MERLKLREMKKAVKDRLAKFDFSLCYSCGTCASGCPIPGIPGMEGWDPRRAIRMLNLGLIDEVVESKFPWVCTGCGRCAYACPMHIDMVPIWNTLKSLRDRNKVPGILHKGVLAVLETGNNLSIPRPDYLAVMADLGKELADDECPGFYIPVDKRGANIIFFPNSKEVFGDYEDMKWWWKIFYAAKENWTIPSDNWEAVDWGLFTGNADVTTTLAKRKIDIVKKLNIGCMIMPDCGGGSYGCRSGIRNCVMENPENEVKAIYLYDYLKDIIEQGRVKFDKSRNSGKIFTWHDSCKHGRELERHFGKAYFDEPRWILKQLVGEAQFVELYPTRANNFCCGAGGGNWPMPFEKEAAAHGRFKVQQIKNSGANVVVVGCSNCRDQIMKRLPKFYPEDCQYEVKYIWQLVAESLDLEPWDSEEITKSQIDAMVQWEKLGVSQDIY